MGEANAYDFKAALAIYCALFLALTFPYWLHGEVAAPYRLSAELGVPDSPANGRIENRKFSDYENGYVPEIARAFNGPRSGWIGLWTTGNELGRPVDHTSGFSPAYPPSALIMAFTDDPRRLITILSLGYCFLSGLVILGLSKELGLVPIAGLLAAGSLAASPFFMYWLTFPLFTAAYCWSAGVMYALRRLFRKRDFITWSLLAFCIYSLLMTAYQQLIVFHAYLVTAFGAHLAWRYFRTEGWRSTLRVLTSVATALAVAGVLAAPVYADLARIAAESARVAPEPSFFTANFPQLDSLSALMRFVALGTFPEIFGNPILPSFPMTYDGRSVTLPIMFLCALGLLLRLRDTWGWWLAVALLCALLFFKPLYLFGIDHLGFNLSRSNPIGILMLPTAVIAAYGADALLGRRRARQHAWAVTAAVACGGVGLVLAITLGFLQGLALRWISIALSCVVLGLLAAQIRRTRPLLLVCALAIVGAYVSFPLMLRQDAAHISGPSPLVDKVREHLPANTRLAVAAPGLPVLPPNLNATLGLASIHTYNSLSSRRYHELIRALGGEVRTYGRSNGAIAPDYGSAAFWMSNIGLVLSPSRLEHENLAYVGQSEGIHLHPVRSRMGCCMQVMTRFEETAVEGIKIADTRTLGLQPAIMTRNETDLLEFDISGGAESLLVLSQRFDSDWIARTRDESGWTKARTVPVNGIFQGVWLPKGTRQVQLQFTPYVRHAWLAHVFWLSLLTALVLQALRTLRTTKT